MRSSFLLPLPKLNPMHLQIEHHTEYQYDNPVRYSIQELRLSPLDSKGQTIVKWQIQSPVKAKSNQDTFGNTCQTLVLDTPYKSMSITAKGEIHTLACHEYQDDPRAVSPYYLLQPTALTQISQPMQSHFELELPKKPNIDSVLALADAIRSSIRYQAGVTTFATTAAQAFTMQAGVCQDHSHIMLSLCRFANIPARYVSGYFFAEESPNLASHAWVDVCLDAEQGRWVSIDVTHACLTDQRHIRLAVGRDYYSAAPIKGIRSGGGQEELRARISIQQVKVL